VVSKGLDGHPGMYPLRAVDRVCDIIDLLAEHPSGLPLSILAAEVSLPKSSAFRYLAALETRGYIARTDDGLSYCLGTPVDGIPGMGPGRLERLVTAAKPLMTRLSGDVTLAMLATLDGAAIRYLWVSASGSGDPRIPKIDDRGMLHATAAGKAIAAQLADERVLSIISVAGLPQATAKTLGSPNALLRELHRIRGEGFAISDQERYSDLRGVAVPIGGETLALGIAGRSDHLTPERVSNSVRQLRRAAVVLARELRA
jgi:IclR family acetate operon transcriptional repressor